MTTTVQPALDGTVPAPKVPAVRRRAADYEAWLAEVRPAYESAAATGRVFTTFQIADEHDLPEPPDHHLWGRLMTLLKDDGFIQTSGWACSDRPTTHHSGVRTWKGTRAARRGRTA